MEESPAAALRRKPRASIKMAAEAVARGDASGLFSAGHTGATVMATHAAFGMLPGVDRRRLPRRSRPSVRQRFCSTWARVSSAGRHICCNSPSWVAYARVAFDIRQRLASVCCRAGRGGHQGQRADARGTPAAEESAPRIRRQRRSAGRIHRRRRRHRVRRLHWQRGPQDQRGTGGGRRKPVE